MRVWTEIPVHFQTTFVLGKIYSRIIGLSTCLKQLWKALFKGYNNVSQVTDETCICNCTTALNADANCSFFVSTSLFVKVPYEALALPRFTVKRPSTIDPCFYFFTSQSVTIAEYFIVRIYQYVSYDVTQWLKLQTMVLSINDNKGAVIPLTHGHQNDYGLTQYDSAMIAHVLQYIQL